MDSQRTFSLSLFVNAMADGAQQLWPGLNRGEFFAIGEQILAANPGAVLSLTEMDQLLIAELTRRHGLPQNKR